MQKNQLLNGFIYNSEDNYIGIDNGSLDSPLSINERSIAKVLKTMRKNGIERLFFGSPFMDLKDVSFLKDFFFLKGLRISLKDYDVEPLKYCPELEELILSFDYKGNLDFSFFKNLKSLSLVWKNDFSKSIFKCKKIENLYVSKYKGLTLNDFKPYSNTLKTLHIIDSSIQTLSGIEHLKELKELHVFGAKNLTDIEDVQNCENLEKVFIYNSQKIEDLHYLMYLKKLKILNLDNLGSIKTIGFLKPLKTLEEFYMTESTNVSDGDVSVLNELRNKHKLQKIIFNNRNHYNYKREELGFKQNPSVASIFNKKKKK